jgi:hypothetical protein
VAQFKYSGTTVTSLTSNLIYKQIKNILYSCNDCYHLFLNSLSPRLLFKNAKIKTHETIILPVGYYECEIRSLTLREEHRRKVFENIVLRRIFGSKRNDMVGGWRKLQKGEFHISYSSPAYN